MRIFTSPCCNQSLYFHSLRCHCGKDVGFDYEAGHFVSTGDHCANRSEISCNWLASQIVGDPTNSLCASCLMTSVIPDTFHDENLTLWAKTEHAKRWVLANLARWQWFTHIDNGTRPQFHLLAEQTGEGEVPVSMGHAEGVVTINVSEADPAELIQRREEFGERLRTMIAHFRHEIAHFIFLERLSENPAFLNEFRTLFGDERADYAQTLQNYYRSGPVDGWQSTFVSEYASAHPHEDWAETFAHLLHLTDITDSFAAAGFTSPLLSAPDYDPYLDPNPENVLNIATQIGLGINHVNRSMGLSDLYPFVLTPRIREKLRFVRAWITSPDEGVRNSIAGELSSIAD